MLLYEAGVKIEQAYSYNIALKINIKVKCAWCCFSLQHHFRFMFVNLFSLNSVRWGRNTTGGSGCMPTIILGADVTHTHPREDNSPSLM